VAIVVLQEGSTAGMVDAGLSAACSLRHTLACFQGRSAPAAQGLGKTVTVMALMLKTRGTLAAAPDGLHAVRAAAGNAAASGRAASAYYEVHATGGATRAAHTHASTAACHSRPAIRCCSKGHGTSG